MTGRKRSDDEQADGLRVTAAQIQVTVGERVLHYAYGDVLPEGIDKETVERLQRRGLISK